MHTDALVDLAARLRSAVRRADASPVRLADTELPEGTIDPLTALMLDRFILGMRRDGSTARPSVQELRQADRLAGAWKELGVFDLDEVTEWLDHCPQITPDVAVELVLAGVTPHEAAEQLWLGRRAKHRPPLWSRVQFQEITPDEAVEELRRAHGA